MKVVEGTVSVSEQIVDNFILDDVVEYKFRTRKRRRNVASTSSSCSYNGVVQVYGFLLICLLYLTNICDCSSPSTSVVALANETSFDILMPNVRPKKNDDYFCAVQAVPEETLYIHEYEPKSDADRAHHMLLYACDDVEKNLVDGVWWDCGHHYRACNNMRIIYAWAKNAPPTILSKDVGYRIGVESNVKYLVLQVHYAHAIPEPLRDQSGFRIHVTPEEPKYLAGIMILLRSSLSIPPETEKIHGDMNCMLQSPSPIYPFAYRVHTHKLGAVVSGYKLSRKTETFEEIGKGNPNWPQAFYPIEKKIKIEPGDIVAARCTFSTLGFPNYTRIGQTANDEMCNLYIMFYTASRDPEDHFIQCSDEEISKQISQHLPADSDVELPRNVTLEEHAKGHGLHQKIVKKPSAEGYIETTKRINHTKKRPGFDTDTDTSYNPEEDRQFKQLPTLYHVDNNWPNPKVILGQASGVDLDPDENVVAFHRGDRTWKFDTFDNQNRYKQKELGPIKEDTVLVIHPKSGLVLHSWGKDMFYMPHDITVAKNGDTYLTDVALHQVFKFTPGSTQPSLVLGEKFVPGNDDKHFCKPAGVAVLNNGDFFVADGYCNSRILKFNSKGVKILEWGRSYQPSFTQYFSRQPPPPNAFSIPHALALSEENDLLCVADRENGRIQCFKASDGSFQFIIESPQFGRLFSVSYSDVNGGTLFAVNGPNSNFQKVQGFVIPLNTKKVAGYFSPNENGFSQPHDIKVSNNGSVLYVVEIEKPYKIWKFDLGPPNPANRRLGKDEKEPKEPERRISGSGTSTSTINSNNAHKSSTENHDKSKKLTSGEEPDLNASIIIMAFLTIPILLFIVVGALLRLRSNGCCKNRNQTKSFEEFFPPSRGFEKLRMDESESDENSDTEIEEFAVSSYHRKPSV